MHTAKHLPVLLPLLLAAAVGSAAADDSFDSMPGNGSCASRNVSAAARGEIECAALASQDGGWKSFSFINGVCVLSESSNCAPTDVPTVFKKRVVAFSSQFGYEQQIGGRRFWVFQQRQTGQVAFNRTWLEYETGFGNGTEFWGGELSSLVAALMKPSAHALIHGCTNSAPTAGLQQISDFTKSHNNTLRIETTTMNGTFYVAEWLNFTVAGASTNYTMNNFSSFLTGSSNISGDAMDVHRGVQFSTIDRDNDARITIPSCSAEYGSGGFWFNSCYRINPNGLYPTQILVDTTAYPYIASGYIQNYITLRYIRMMLQI